ncbi:MAG TPA: hypothetical protein VGJ48_23870 [Pyrinomonadaceae bacterium]
MASSFWRIATISVFTTLIRQEKAREFAGQKVKITGRVTGKTIRVTAIEAAT